jgi:hypothetical protein
MTDINKDGRGDTSYGVNTDTRTDVTAGSPLSHRGGSESFHTKGERSTWHRLARRDGERPRFRSRAVRLRRQHLLNRQVRAPSRLFL